MVVVYCKIKTTKEGGAASLVFGQAVFLCASPARLLCLLSACMIMGRPSV